jgi:prepilin-type N-terminal cleavage/methylation domain-containing protein
MDKRSMFFLRSQTRGRYGFTLVEVIVVLVILAILAAIAIPALTGYIDKAQDKQYIAMARDAATAMRTVFDLAYADGTLEKGFADDAERESLLVTGKDVGVDMKSFDPGAIANYNNGITFYYWRSAAELVGMHYPQNDAYFPGAWTFHFFAPRSSDYTILNAPAFQFTYYPDGNVRIWEAQDGSKARPAVRVFYGVGGLSTAADGSPDVTNATYDPSAGYSVFRWQKKTT